MSDAGAPQAPLTYVEMVQRWYWTNYITIKQMESLIWDLLVAGVADDPATIGIDLREGMETASEWR